MIETAFLCTQCRNLFSLPAHQTYREAACPKCGSTQITDAPCWAPLGSGTNIFDSPEWEYACRACWHKFKLPIPQSPTEEKNRRCPRCHSEIIRLVTPGGEPLYCG